MAANDVSITRDGQGNESLHPYIVALVRWCVSCVWRTATVLLHRLLFSPLPITGNPGPKSVPKRAATHEHLHPEPKVECIILHQPAVHNVDVIFVHGLYGSLGNTWRQGEWSTKYKIPPKLVPLIRPECILQPCQHNQKNEKDLKENKLYTDEYKAIDDNFKTININNQTSVNDNNFNVNLEHNNNKLIKEYNNDTMAFENITNKLRNMRTIIPKDEMLMTESFYNDTLFESVNIVDSFEAQAEFVRDLFKNENEKGCDNKNCDKTINDINETFENAVNDFNKIENEVSHDCVCKAKGTVCQVGCGCICDECYSSCWPKDWIKEDHPDARVISINYTSDPYLWRPLWKSQCKRLELNERAEQMTQQLLDLGVGSKPIIWVGHSKGGLFIKQIYCEAYEAYLKLNGIVNAIDGSMNIDQQDKTDYDDSYLEKTNTDIENGDTDVMSNDDTDVMSNDDRCGINYENESGVDMEIVEGDSEEETESSGKKTLEETEAVQRRSQLWTNSAGFMFYSVPHRGSSLADIKTPITTRSVELMEIRKDNSTLLSLQSRWLNAWCPRSPHVASCFETRRTRMSVLWLTIVPQYTADAGMGALCGVNVDHREICKPTSRKCILYTQLMNLMHAALERCHCQ